MQALSMLLSTALLLAAATASHAVVRFDEVPAGPADGVMIEGVLFTDTFGALIGEPAVALPGIRGAALYDVLSSPVGPAFTNFSFEFSPSTTLAFSYAVEVPPAENFLGIVTVLSAPNGFTVAQFELPGPAVGGIVSGRFSEQFTGLPIGAVQISFSLLGEAAIDGAVAAIDNLRVSPVPEPSTAALGIVGLLTGLALARLGALRNTRSAGVRHGVR
jgi:hypothetical protein